MEFIYSDGGRSKYFKAPNVRDCVTRAICNASGLDYKEVYDEINRLAKSEKTGCRKRGTSSARDGVYKRTIKKYLEDELGWIFIPCMTIGSGCTTHLRESELPTTGSFVLSLSEHLSCWKDGKLYDTYDCSRDGNRCVYGYWRAPSKEEYKSHLNKIKLKEEQENQRKLAKEKNKKIKSQYAKKIKVLQQKIKALENERDSKLISL